MVLNLIILLTDASAWWDGVNKSACNAVTDLSLTLLALSATTLRIRIIDTTFSSLTL